MQVATPGALDTAAYSLTISISNNSSRSLASAAAVTSQPCQAPTGVAVGRLTTSARVSFTASNSDLCGYAVAYTPTGGAAQTASAAARPVNPRGP